MYEVSEGGIIQGFLSKIKLYQDKTDSVMEIDQGKPEI